MTFEIDTGTDVTAISEQVSKNITDREGSLKDVPKSLYGPGGTKLIVVRRLT